ncbi:MAG TPA: hypothetical protein ENJ82_09645, partial [Bacteroidetes bacterium]|nr:hypothetical protein [Bacteroidota bacterium]
MNQIRYSFFRKTLLTLILLLSVGHAYTQWAIQPTSGSADLVEVHFFDQNNGIAVGSAAAVTTDGGNNWNFLPVPFALHDVYMLGSQTAVAVGSDLSGNQSVVRTTDLGQTWTTTYSGSAGTIHGLNFFSSLHGAAAADSGRVMLTSDGGLNWLCLVPVSTDDFYAVSMLTLDTLYAAGKGGNVYKTTTGGSSWTVSLASSTEDWYAMDFRSHSDGMVGGYNNLISYNYSKRTTDYGNSWVATANAYSPVSDLQMTSVNDIYQVNHTQFIQHTYGGIGWQAEQVPGLTSADSLVGLFFLNDTTGWAVGDNGLIVATNTNGNCTPNPRLSQHDICLGDSIVLSAATGWQSYSWLDSATNAAVSTFFTPTNGMTIYFQATHPICGTYFDTLRFTVHYCDSVWPGDANADGVANMADLLTIGLGAGSVGSPRAMANNTWTPQAKTNWGPTFFGVIDYKHADCDGNGLIDVNDTLPLSLNYSLTHTKSQHVNATSGFPLYLEPLFDSLSIGDTGYVRVMLGDLSNPITDLHGIAFTFSYDPSLIDTNSVSISFDTTWIAPTNASGQGMYKDFYNLGRTDIGYTHMNQLNSSGYGMIAGITFVTIDNISGKNNSISKSLQLNLS